MPGGFCGKGKDYRGNDEFYTMKNIWETIQQYIPKDKLIWEAFYGNGQSASYLKELGFNVVSYDEDFFENNRADIVVSNPPFSKKKEIIQRLVSLKKPFILIVPFEIITYNYIRELEVDFQILIPKGRMSFMTPDNTIKKFNFPCIYLTYGLNLKKDIIYV